MVYEYRSERLDQHVTTWVTLENSIEQKKLKRITKTHTQSKCEIGIIHTTSRE